jgi:phage replication-related protein YjqB (UPF0714/DUF867 family)
LAEDTTCFSAERYVGFLAESRSYADILEKGHVLGPDFRITFGDSKIDRCLLAAPHGGGIEPGTSEIMRAVAETGGWAWYEFAGFLRQGNKDALHITSTDFAEPTLLHLLPQTPFLLAFHGAIQAAEPIVYVGGKWEVGRQTVIRSMNARSREHGIHAADAVEGGATHLRGLEDKNITNRGRLAEGVQLEFSRVARDRLFPPDSSREARGRWSPQLRRLAVSIHEAIEQLCRLAADRLETIRRS